MCRCTRPSNVNSNASPLCRSKIRYNDICEDRPGSHYRLTPTFNRQLPERAETGRAQNSPAELTAEWVGIWCRWVPHSPSSQPQLAILLSQFLLSSHFAITDFLGEPGHYGPFPGHRLARGLRLWRSMVATGTLPPTEMLKVF